MAFRNLLTIITILCIGYSYSSAQNKIPQQIGEEIDKNNKAAKKAKADSIKKAQQAKKKGPAKKSDQPYYSTVPISPQSNNTTAITPKTINANTYDPTFFLREENTGLADGPPRKKDSIRAIDTTEFAKRHLAVKQSTMNSLYQHALKDKSFQAGLERKLKYGKKHPLYTFKKHKLKSGIKTFGWHPYWMGNAYKNYNFSLLSAVAFFSYQLDPSNGSYTNTAAIKAWKETKMIDEAQKHKTKVLLSVYSGGKSNNTAFLNNRGAQTNFIRIILALLKERKANGVHLDFAGLSSDDKQAFSNFIIDLSSQLRKAIKGAWLTISLPPINFDDSFDVRELNKYVNLFVLSGGEFYGEGVSDMAGPLSVVKSGSNWWDYDLDRGIDEYLASGVEAEKLLLTVNYYGAEWKTAALRPPSKSNGFVKYRTYAEIKSVLGNASGYEDPESMSMFYPFKDRDGNYHQIWYEDSLSLSKKYDWVLSKKIGGVGIWALGFDNGSPQLWEALASKMADPLKDPSASKKGKKVRARGFFSRIRSSLFRLIRNPKAMLMNPQYFASMLILLLGPAFAGVYVIYRHGCRLRRSMNLLLKGGIIMFLIMAFALTALVLTRFKHTTPIILIMAGFVIGAIVFLLLTRRSLSEREMP